MIKFFSKNLKKINGIIQTAMFAALPLEPVKMKSSGVLIGSLINTLLTIAAGLVVLFIILGGIRYIRSWGEVEDMQAAKKILLYAVLGLIVILVSYSAVVTLDKIING